MSKSYLEKQLTCPGEAKGQSTSGDSASSAHGQDRTETKGAKWWLIPRKVPTQKPAKVPEGTLLPKEIQGVS